MKPFKNLLKINGEYNRTRSNQTLERHDLFGQAEGSLLYNPSICKIILLFQPLADSYLKQSHVLGNQATASVCQLCLLFCLLFQLLTVTLKVLTLLGLFGHMKEIVSIISHSYYSLRRFSWKHQPSPVAKNRCLKEASDQNYCRI